MCELWSFFWFSNFWAFFIKFSGFLWFCLRRNFLLCSIPDISDFGWASYGRFSGFPIFEHFPSNFQGLPQEKLNSLLNSANFRLWMGEIAWKMSELWFFFCFSEFFALSINFSGFCVRKNFILCSIPSIFGFRWVKSHSNERFMVYLLFFPFLSTFHSLFRVLPQEKLNSLLNSGHFTLWVGEIAWKISELWSFFGFSNFWAISIKLSGFASGET